MTKEELKKRGYWITVKGRLAGYHARDAVSTRHAALRKAVRNRQAEKGIGSKEAASVVKRELLGVANKLGRVSPESKAVMMADHLWISRQYGLCSSSVKC